MPDTNSGVLDRPPTTRKVRLGRKKAATPTRVARLTATTLDRLERNADVFGLTVAEYVDLLIEAGLIRDDPKAEEMLAARRKVVDRLRPKEKGHQ